MQTNSPRFCVALALLVGACAAIRELTDVIDALKDGQGGSRSGK